MKVPQQNLKSLIDIVYPNINVVGMCNDNYLSERTILASRNQDVDCINQIILNILSGNQRIYDSADSTIIEEDRVIEARILCGDYAGQLTFIPCITLNPSTTELPIVFKRRQFPVRVAYAMTINKSQGQSVKHVGLDLRTPVFLHRQLYVALSRCTSPNSIKILFPQNSTNTVTTNIVYLKFF
ncbi:43057_t:CDS:2 [Gigaspora margarita]|uniref:43057_t:CDS:1 n=1 Tax=Gigaspora margarita TaxID=4874 RepID=A0ABN7VNW5_GIGMA|nr:43057_t:CDS:2 [Gigaspora margarita]